MLSLLMAALLADWRYDGFALDPARPEPVKRAQRPADNPPPPQPPPVPVAPPETGDSPVTSPRQPSAPRPAPRKPRTIRVKASPRPTCLASTVSRV
jgi:hypothetical protein